MKEAIFPFVCVVCIALAGCSTSGPEKVTTHVITVGITQVADSEYSLQASEKRRMSTQKYCASSAEHEQLNYPEVLATVGVGERTVEIRDSSGGIAAAASLSIYVEGGDLFAAYRLMRETVDAGMQTENGTLKLHGGRSRPDAKIE